MRHLFVFLFGFFSTISTEASTGNDFLSKVDAFLKKNVKNGFVAYQSINQNLSEIESLYATIGKASIGNYSEAEKKAFYINSYNIIVIYWVAKHYPLKSPLDDSGFFDKVKHKVAGEEMTLNVLEIKKLLQPYKDGRFHFVLACAAKSCPPLASFAYTPEKLDQQLTERTSAALNNADWIKVRKGTKKVELSKIFEWYKGDFTQAGKTQLDWINGFRKEKIPAEYSVGYYEYDWNLNELTK
jgi:hypothetical protein